MANRYSVLDTFSVTTPSLSVVIRADDTPIPAELRAQPNPGNLVTVHAAWRGEGKQAEQLSENEEDMETQNALRERQMVQQRLMHLHSQQNLDQSQLKELKELQEQENTMRGLEEEQMREHAHYLTMLQRADSKHADRIYGVFGAPPPIKPLDAVVTEEDPEGFIKRISTYETKDFTYWDKLRRRNTETVIRRWHTYIPTGEEDTAFFERNILAHVAGEAYRQGIYYKELDTGLTGAREYKLPTESYVAPPVYIRRTGNPEKRVYDPIRQMARNVYSCSTCASC
ncbi:uncharacterized protein LOC34618757 [Cyclospora cayetanensis]|uniref:Uncharacterized protein LOC34618757 n=1 Tax=Cyclospora cayetanensis TaxID=88456 RepID=A0A6P6RUG5_9EIME|nr:uncharacterized protein LOC34618757 [Cyclospora cayetanensis]